MAGAAAGLTFERIEDEARLRAIEPEWRQLFETAGAPSPFLDFDWVLMCFRRMAADGPHTPLVATVRENGVLVLGLPLQMRRYRWLFRRYHGVQNYFPQYNDALMAATGSAPEWVRTLLRGLGRGLIPMVLVLEQVPARSRLNELMASALLSDKLYGTAAATDLRPGFDAYMASFGAKTRSHMRRMHRHLERHGEVAFRLATPDTMNADLDWILEKKRAWTPPSKALRRWLTHPGYEADLRDLASRWLQTGRMWIAQVEVGGQRIAGGITFNAGSECLFYAITYDPAFAPVSPGRILSLQLIAKATADGYEVFDFMAGNWEWKDRLKTWDRRIGRLKIRLG